MATAKKAAKKATTKSAAKKVAVKSASSGSDTDQNTKTQAKRTTISKQEARASKTAALANAPEVKKTMNPKGSWPFPTGERP